MHPSNQLEKDLHPPLQAFHCLRNACQARTDLLGGFRRYDCHLAAEWPLTLSNAHWLQARRALPLTMEGQAWMTFGESRH